jgi:hypothetical protein
MTGYTIPPTGLVHYERIEEYHNAKLNLIKFAVATKDKPEEHERVYMISRILDDLGDKISVFILNADLKENDDNEYIIECNGDVRRITVYSACKFDRLVIKSAEFQGTVVIKGMFNEVHYNDCFWGPSAIVSTRPGKIVNVKFTTDGRSARIGVLDTTQSVNSQVADALALMSLLFSLDTK